MDMRKLVGRNFGRFRRAKGFTQESFAEASGFTQQYISGLETGRRNPTVVTLFELASALGVSHVDLVVPDDEAAQRADEERQTQITLFNRVIPESRKCGQSESPARGHRAGLGGGVYSPFFRGRDQSRV